MTIKRIDTMDIGMSLSVRFPEVSPAWAFLEAASSPMPLFIAWTMTGLSFRIPMSPATKMAPMPMYRTLL